MLPREQAIAILKRADLCKDNALYKEAFAKYQDVIKFNKDEDLVSYAYNGMGIIYSSWELYSPADAEKFYQLSIKYDENNLSAFYNLGCLYYICNQIGLAIEYIYKAHQLNPNSPFVIEELEKKLNEHSKDVLFKEILDLPLDMRLYLLKECLNPKSLLGKRFYTCDAFEFKCSIEYGVLKNIYDYLKTEKHSTCVATVGLFANKSKYGYNVLLNDIYECDKRFKL